MDKNEKRRQHTVPKTYLRGFARDGSVRVCDLETRKTSMQSISDASVIKHFYTVWTAGDEKMFLEDFFAEIEGRYAVSKDRLLESVTLTQEDLEAVSDFMVTMLVRTPRIKRHLDVLVEGIGMSMIDPGNRAIFAATATSLAANILPYLIHSRMILAQWNNYSVITTDNPVMLVDATHILFPVNHRSVLLVILPGGSYRGIGWEGDSGTDIHPYQVIEDSNNLAIRAVDRLVFAHPSSDFDLTPV